MTSKYAAQRLEFRETNRERLAKASKEYREKNKEKVQAKDRDRGLSSKRKAEQSKYRENNREAERLRLVKYREENREVIRLKAIQYRLDNREAISVAAGVQNYRNKVKRGKIYLNYKSEIKKIYEKRRPGEHVDHIIPVNGKNVTGLHVPWNLQILAAKVNISKNNVIDLKEASKVQYFLSRRGTSD